ncbi:hypothetical protein CPLU01_09660 [Colletotrichum plurivorum]|uniref:Uncharacterized protein n=1 Tax=Colletotrichum plurivorum TaxID=2175906 RepID=A0A8H6K7H7_9PEZI|nr:hypothetical protein CPLU01_09660 [Colletotrichum plurivorum]
MQAFGKGTNRSPEAIVLIKTQLSIARPGRRTSCRVTSPPATLGQKEATKGRYGELITSHPDWLRGLAETWIKIAQQVLSLMDGEDLMLRLTMHATVFNPKDVLQGLGIPIPVGCLRPRRFTRLRRLCEVDVNTQRDDVEIPPSGDNRSTNRPEFEHEDQASQASGGTSLVLLKDPI